jgi:hypothetical protein
MKIYPLDLSTLIQNRDFDGIIALIISILQIVLGVVLYKKTH